MDRTSAWLMEIPEVPNPPREYESFYYTRLFWRELGRHYDEMTRAEVLEARAFMVLEQQHPQRFEKRGK